MDNKRIRRYLVNGVIGALLLAGLFYFYLAEQRFRSPAGVTATINASSLYLKSGPGVSFERLGAYPSLANITVLGQAAGGDWLKVETTDGKRGWMAKKYLFVNGDVTSLPNVDLAGSVSVVGSVTDSLQNPVEGVTLSFTPEDNDPKLTFFVQTDAQGKFYAYFPADALGKWAVQVAGVDCGAPVMDSHCELSQYYLASQQAEVNLPQAVSPVFVYQAAETFIQGVVHDSSGHLATGIRVTGYREDGATSTGITSRDGQFRLPAAKGQWKIFTLQAGQSSSPVRVIVGAGGPEQSIQLVTP